MLLQILDDGRLTDGKGRTVDFKNTVIIMTSNIGAQWIRLPNERADSDESEMQSEGRGGAAPALPPGVPQPHRRRRSSSTPLELAEIKRIVEIQLKRLKKMIEDRDLKIEITEAAKDYLAKEGYDPAFGARPLKRALQKLIIDPLAMRLLEGKFKAGDTVFVTMTPQGKLDLSLEPEPMTVH